MPNIDNLIAFENGELDQDETVAFIQDGIDKGWVWQLQGFYGRTAASLIDAGLCHNRKPKLNCCDANGNCNQAQDCPARKDPVNKSNQTQWTNYQNSRNGLKHPRTLNETFGPYTDNRIVEVDPPFDWQDKLVVVAGIVAACACALIITIWS